MSLSENERIAAEANLIRSFREAFGKKQVEVFSNQLRKKRGEFSADQFQLMEEIVASQKSVLNQHKNVLRREEEVRQTKKDLDHTDKEEHPGDVDVGVFEEMPKMMGKPGLGWKTKYYKVGKNSLYPSEFTRRQKIEAFKNNNKKVAFAEPVTGDYLRHLKYAKNETAEEMRLQAARLLSVLAGGNDLSDGEKSKYQTKIGDREAFADSLALGAGSALHGIFDVAGRGLWSEKDPASNKNFKNYVKKRNDFLSNLVWKYPNDKRRILEELQNMSADERAMIDPVTFEKLMDLAKKEIKEGDAPAQAVIEEINKLNHKLYDEAKNQSEDQDDMWKFRLVQALLLITPFAGVSLLGPVFGAIGEIFSSGIADGIASLVTSEYLWIFGDFAELIQFDEAVHWILADSPILGDAVSLVDAALTSNFGAQISGGVLSLSLASPLAGLFVAGVFSVFRGETEVRYLDKYKGKFENHEKELRNLINNSWMSDDEKKVEFKNYVTEKYELLRFCYKNEELINFIKSVDEEPRLSFSKIMGDGFGDELAQKGVDINNINFENLRDRLVEIHDAKDPLYNKIVNRFHLFYGLQNEASLDNKSAENFDIIEKFSEACALNENDSHKSKLISDGEKIIDQNYDFANAQGRGIPCNSGSLGDLDKRGEAAKKASQLVINADVQELENAAQNHRDVDSGHHMNVPSSSPRPPLFAQRPNQPVLAH